MCKAKAHAIGNLDAYVYVIVEKDRDFFRWLSRLMKEGCGFTMGLEFRDASKPGEPCDPVEKDVADYTDRHESYSYINARDEIARESRADVFFGKERAFVVIKTPEGNRKRLMDALGESTEGP